MYKIAKKREYNEGLKAFAKGLTPFDCPYLNEYGDNSVDILEWMEGWSSAWKNFMKIKQYAH